MRSRCCRPRAASLGLVFGVLLFSGCGGTLDNTTHVSGTVTFDGKPLPAGMIVFEPDPAKGNRGQQGHADIKDGRFDTRSSGKGVAIGPQVVRITGGDGANPEPFTPFGKLLFEEHTVRLDVSKEPSAFQLDVPSPKHKKK
ncbi:hypothetical protein [Limnoglobus roseus]|uniref:Carboxypeptidase regulatory-like domain-containing protein n=1 Tax=Limnoglobus roseus TaxID=2598579 RepID=A0A5C1AIG7_9BACT|nr:hypothetical protein [Limnoglobus roseus]QEL17957.1 carboxypeptidase regulatory-like domain-containing protein [Limnoglobus roseus]